MIVLQIIIGVIAAVGVGFLLADFMKIPSLKASKAANSVGRKGKKKTGVIELYRRDFATKLAGKLHLNEFKRANLVIDLRTANITPLVLQRYISELMEHGNLRTGGGLSASSVNAIITVIQSSLKVAYNLGYLEAYTADKVKRPRIQEKQIECFTPAEQKKIEQAVLTDKRPKMFGIILCLYTGLRIGELLALEWSDIDFSKGELTVSKTCHDAKTENGYKRITDTPKTTTSRRVIPIPRQILPLLREQKKKSRSTYVVGEDRLQSVRSYQYSFSLLLKKLGIPHRGFHALRHTFATRALECGMDVKTLSEILGHKNPVVTLNRYAHSLMPHKHEAMNRLGKLF